jgi:Tol biopolymer transport system component
LPIGLSPDASYLAVFTNDEFIWNLHQLQAIPSPPEPGNFTLFEGSTHPEGDCRRMGDFAFNEVRFNPVFSQDSEWIYFLVHGPCSRRGDPPTNRDDYDILRINRNLMDQPENVTNNLRASHWSNHNIGDFALSPDGSKLVFTAERMNNVQSRAIWIINPDSGAYDCTRKDPLPVLDGRERCEFISDDSTGADATYRDLRFHRVQVPR